MEAAVGCVMPKLILKSAPQQYSLWEEVNTDNKQWKEHSTWGGPN